jgi:hypothetical protein
MARLSVTTAWNETTAFIKAEARLLFPLAFMLIALPAAVTRALAPRVPAGEPVQPGTVFLLALGASIVLAVIGNIALSSLAIRAGTSVREAIVQGARRAPALVAASILVGCGLVAVAFLVSFFVVAGVTAANGRAPGAAEMVTASWILLLLLAPVIAYLSARMVLMTPVAAAEAGGPFAIIARSWRLTGPHQFRMLGLVAILAMLAIVLQLAVESILGILLIALAGAPEPGSLSSILILLSLALLNTVLVTCAVTLVARVYAQLSSKGS